MSSKVRKTKTSKLWRYFKPIDEHFAICNMCKQKLSYKTSTSNLKKHIQSKHPSVKLPDCLKPQTCQDGEKNDKETQQNDHNDSKTTQAQVYDTNSAFPESSVQFHVNETCENEVANSSDDDAAAQENVYPSVLLKQEQNSFELQTPVDSIYPEQRNTQALEQIAKQLKLRNKLKYFELFQTFEGFEDL